MSTRTDPENFRAAITDKTKAIFAETIGNPSLHVLDIEAVANIAHENGIPLLVDSTFSSPYGRIRLSLVQTLSFILQRNGLVDMERQLAVSLSMRVNLTGHKEKFPGFTEPDDTYHGLRYGIDAAAAAFATKLRVQLLRDFGPCLSPDNAFNFFKDLKHFIYAVTKHNENALKQLQNIWKHIHAVEWVTYTGSEDHPSYELGKKVFEKRAWINCKLRH